MHPSLPYDALLAEAQAFPFAAPEAFDLRSIELERARPRVMGGRTAKLWTALERRLMARSGGLTVEALCLIRDQSWFLDEEDNPCEPKRPLVKHLVLLAREHLEMTGSLVRLRPDGNPAVRAARWRWLSLSLPSDLLIAALAAHGRRPPPVEQVQLVSPGLAQVLTRPCAETHLHVGAGVPFTLLWSEQMAALAHELPQRDAIREPIPFGNPDRFLSILCAAAIGRTLMAAFLWRRERGARHRSFKSFVGDTGPDTLHAMSENIYLGRREQEPTWRSYQKALATMCGTAQGVPGAGLLQRAYAALLGGRLARKQAERGRPVECNDPLAVWLRPAPGFGSSEIQFATTALTYLLYDGAADDAFAEAFLQYQRIRSQFYCYLVEQPGTSGLDWFTRYYGRISPYRKPLDASLVKVALQAQSRDLHLGALEVRTSPYSSWHENWKLIREVAEQAREHGVPAGQQRPEIALILHFIKSNSVKQGGRERMHADPRGRYFLSRHGAWFAQRRTEARAIARALRARPRMLLLLRALDVANVELAQPTWVLRPLLEHVRRAASEAAMILGHTRPTWGVRPLRTTLHLGEDFLRLSEGLRRMHEAIEFGLLELGDRIGHGVALGMDPQRWADHMQASAQPAEERLDDLLWELDRYQKGDLPAATSRVEYVRAEVTRLGEFIYRNHPTAEHLIEARWLRHQPAVLSRLDYPLVRAPFKGTAEQSPPMDLLYRYLTDGDVYVRGQRPQLITASPTSLASEVALLKDAQSFLRCELGRREITIESNPSSNLIIGGFSSVEDLPAFRLQPLQGDTKDAPVLVSVNTDNPLTFASCLADEMAHVYFGLLRLGKPAALALDWVDRARDNGWRSRFTLPASADKVSLSAIAGPKRSRPH